MPKVTLDINTFKILASDTRLEILKALDKKKMTLQELTSHTNMQKATLHEHLSKLTAAELVKRRERNGHKWVYYDLSWKAKCLLHPETGRVAVMIGFTILCLGVGIWGVFSTVVSNMVPSSSDRVFGVSEETIILAASDAVEETVAFPYVPVLAFVAFAVLLVLTVWRMQKNKKPRL